jgi:N-acyl amino acid synthase of PEP-CTERM/exosortase system
MTVQHSMTTGEGFRRYFQILLAVVESDRHAAFRIRHSVYCEDLGWEAVRADGLETDEFDAHSLHCLIRSAASAEDIGCVRLVLTRPENPYAALPFERSCGDALDRSLIDPAAMPRDRIAEVSRLAIVGQYRRRRGEEKTPGIVQDADFGTPDRPRFPYLLVGLYMGVFALADMHGLEKLFLLSEPRLARHLNKIGIINRPIGSPIEHRGLRAPAVMDVREVIDNLDPLLGSVYSVVRAELEAAFRAAPVAPVPEAVISE